MPVKMSKLPQVEIDEVIRILEAAIVDTDKMFMNQEIPKAQIVGYLQGSIKGAIDLLKDNQ